MHILLTGATGYLGRHVLHDLIARGNKCTCIKRPSSNISIIDKSDKVQFIDYSENDNGFLFSCAPFDAVVHLAASYGRRGETVTQVAKSNLLMTINLLDISQKLGIKTFYYASTTIDRYTNPYALSKVQASEWGKLLSKFNGPRFIELKFEHFYGPNDDPTKFTTFIFESLVQNQPEIKLTPGEQQRDFIYIDDAVSAIHAIIEIENTKNTAFESWEIGSGSTVSLKEFVNIVRNTTKSKTNVLFGALPYRHNETMLSVANIAPLQALGWNPQVSLSEGISRSLKAIRHEESL
ncbi:NAD-dependent epimerase/dehydratase family protein [Solidesulfovibrio alcoholivorans]|uniref:NAD-dependent epimerase/dehydratase family protein n=1 Tax=Solidesulfovibrio alcoholivorans TaxID=81406 RepID=UPI0009FD73B5|nr:NAD(P)-dependent oxidoreductase [Solidesulfovibrio alcoholivorans]